MFLLLLLAFHEVSSSMEFCTPVDPDNTYFVTDYYRISKGQPSPQCTPVVYLGENITNKYVLLPTQNVESGIIHLIDTNPTIAGIFICPADGTDSPGSAYFWYIGNPTVSNNNTYLIMEINTQTCQKMEQILNSGEFMNVSVLSLDYNPWSIYGLPLFHGLYSGIFGVFYFGVVILAVHRLYLLWISEQTRLSVTFACLCFIIMGNLFMILGFSLKPIPVMNVPFAELEAMTDNSATFPTLGGAMFSVITSILLVLQWKDIVLLAQALNIDYPKKILRKLKKPLFIMASVIFSLYILMLVLLLSIGNSGTLTQILTGIYCIIYLVTAILYLIFGSKFWKVITGHNNNKNAIPPLGSIQLISKIATTSASNIFVSIFILLGGLVLVNFYVTLMFWSLVYCFYFISSVSQILIFGAPKKQPVVSESCSSKYEN